MNGTHCLGHRFSNKNKILFDDYKFFFSVQLWVSNTPFISKHENSLRFLLLQIKINDLQLFVHFDFSRKYQKSILLASNKRLFGFVFIPSIDGAFSRNVSKTKTAHYSLTNWSIGWLKDSSELGEMKTVSLCECSIKIQLQRTSKLWRRWSREINITV